MKKEYKEKLELSKKLLHDSLKIRSPEGESMFWKGHNLMEELVITKSADVLCGLFDLFTEENENGVCETLENQIFQNFTMEQIIEALYKKFPILLINNKMRAEAFAEACMNTNNFDKFRDIFNKAKSSESRVFIDKFRESYGKDFSEEISILMEDMKNWRQ